MRSGCAASLPVCAAESLSRLNISVISFPQAIKSPQTAQLKGKWFNHWDNLHKRPLTRTWDLHLCFVFLLHSFSKPPLDSCEVSNLLAKLGWVLAVNWHSLALVSTMTLRWERMKCYSSLSITGWIFLLRINSSLSSTWVYLFSIAVCTSCLAVCSRHTICVSCMKQRQSQLQAALRDSVLGLLNTEHRVRCCGNILSLGKRGCVWDSLNSRNIQYSRSSYLHTHTLTQGWMQHVHICYLGIFKSILGNVWNH